MAAMMFGGVGGWGMAVDDVEAERGSWQFCRTEGRIEGGCCSERPPGTVLAHANRPGAARRKVHDGCRSNDNPTHRTDTRRKVNSGMHGGPGRLRTSSDPSLAQ